MAPQVGARGALAAHTDFEAFTVIHQRARGLQLWRPLGDGGGRAGGSWAWARAAPDDAFCVVLAGDALEFRTNGRVRAARHRVRHYDHHAAAPAGGGDDTAAPAGDGGGGGDDSGGAVSGGDGGGAAPRLSIVLFHAARDDADLRPCQLGGADDDGDDCDERDEHERRGSGGGGGGDDTALAPSYRAAKRTADEHFGTVEPLTQLRHLLCRIAAAEANGTAADNGGGTTATATNDDGGAAATSDHAGGTAELAAGEDEGEDEPAAPPEPKRFRVCL